MTSFAARITLIIVAMRRALWPLLALVPAYARILEQYEAIANAIADVISQLEAGTLVAPADHPTSALEAKKSGSFLKKRTKELSIRLVPSRPRPAASRQAGEAPEQKVFASFFKKKRLLAFCKPPRRDPFSRDFPPHSRPARKNAPRCAYRLTPSLLRYRNNI